jgi:predicted nucleic acid-binding protein
MLDCAVVNAGPLVALSLVRRLDLLPALFRQVWIPDTVYREVVEAGRSRPGAAEVSSAAWAKPEPVVPPPDEMLLLELDRGEAEVIALAGRLGPCLAVIDERRGRRIAQRAYGLPVHGSAGLLVAAKRTGLIGEVRPTLLALRSAGYYLADRVVEAACAAAGESP